MRLTGSRVYTRATPVPKMPPGLVELMEGLTKDVLRNNPSNVYKFCANHLEKLLEMRDGPSSEKLLTLEDKISKAQEKVRQRALERQKLFDSKVRSAENYTPERVDSGKGQNLTRQDLAENLRAPVYHDQNLSLSSEVEISHAPSDNFTTTKDFDEANEIPTSNSANTSSVSKSTVTVIDLITSNSQESDIEEDINNEINNINQSKLDINKDEQVKENTDIVNKKNKIYLEKNIEFPKIEISNDEPIREDSENEIVDYQENETAIENHIQIRENIELPVTDSSDQQVVTEDSGSAITIISCEENSTKNLGDFAVEQPSKTVKNHENETKYILKPLDDNGIVEENKNMRSANDTSYGLVSKIETDLSVAVGKNIIKDSTIEIKEVTDDILNKTVSTENLDNESKKNTDIDLANIHTADESLTETTQPKLVKDVVSKGLAKSSIDSHGEDFGTKDIISVEIDKTNNDVNEVDEVIHEIKIPTLDTIEKNIIENQPNGLNTSADEKSEVFDDNSSEYPLKSRHNNDLQDKDSIIFTEKVDEEDNIRSNSISVQEGSAENNDDSSVIGSDLSKTEDDNVLRSDIENGHNSMDLETAAVTIQKVFRSFLFKSKNSTFEDITNDEATSLEEDNDKNKEEYLSTANLNNERRPLGITRMDTVLQTVNEEKSLSLSTDDSSTLSSAATTIQAHVRGFLVRNRLNSYKTVSTNSLVNSNEILDTDAELLKNNRTVLNIHIVPGESPLSRDESLLTSMDLSLDGSPSSSTNLHPLSYDLVSERRKLLKREDAIQSVSPPSNNSGKLSEDSVKEIIINEDIFKLKSNINEKDEPSQEDDSPETLVTAVPDVAVHDMSNGHENTEIDAEKRKRSVSSDETDVITPYIASPRSLVGDFGNTTKLLHSGEFHDVVLPTKVSRSDTTVVRGE